MKTAITVTCRDCRGDDNRPLVSPQNCEDCADEWIKRHRGATGHTDIHVDIVQPLTADDLRTRLARRRAAFMVRRMGWDY